MVVELKKKIKRNTDILARYGGEEFVILLPNTTIEDAVKMAESSRISILELGLPHENSSGDKVVTISIGVASRLPGHDSEHLDLLHAADTLLYKAKQNGRNKVEY